MKTPRITIEITAHNHRMIKACCARLGLSMKEFIQAVVIEKVEEANKIWENDIKLIQQMDDINLCQIE